MEDLSAINTLAVTESCSACYNQINEDDSFCGGCGYPLKGTVEEKNNFISVRNSKEIDLADANNKIKTAGRSLYWIAGATVLSGFIFYFVNKDINLIIVNLILGAIYAGLGAWSQKKPLAAIISGFALYVLIFILNVITNPSSIANGIILKILFVGYFIKGIKSAIEAEKIKKELNIE